MKTMLALLTGVNAVTQVGLASPAGDSALAFNVTFDAAKSATPLDGRLLLLLSTDPAEEPRFQINDSPKTQIVFGLDVEDWKPGEALIFDDTIEHEAWNGSSELRAVLIFDVWNPHLNETERALVCELLQGVRDYYAQDEEVDL